MKYKTINFLIFILILNFFSVYPSDETTSYEKIITVLKKGASLIHYFKGPLSYLKSFSSSSARQISLFSSGIIHSAGLNQIEENNRIKNTILNKLNNMLQK